MPSPVSTVQSKLIQIRKNLSHKDVIFLVYKILIVFLFFLGTQLSITHGLLSQSDVANKGGPCEEISPTNITSQNTVDNDFGTYWSKRGIGASIQANLGTQQTICYIDIAWVHGDERVYDFEVSTSTDKRTFTNIFTGESNGNSSLPERYDFADINAQYVKITVNGNSQDDMAGIVELDLYISEDNDGTDSLEQPLTVINTDPGNRDTRVLLNTSSVSATFNEPLNNLSITNSSFLVKEGNNSKPLDGRVSLSSDGKSAIFKPSSPLSPSTSYTATLSTDVKSMSDKPLSSAKTWSFITVTDSQKHFVSIMRANYDDQSQLVDLYSSYINKADIALSHPNEENLEFTMQIPVGEHGVQYFSLEEIKSKAASLRSDGVDIISYDIEKEYSPSADIQDPVATVREVCQEVHKYKMKCMVTPARALTTQFGAQIAEYVDFYNIQAQGLQAQPSQYKAYVENIVSKLRSANSEMSITVQVSTSRGTLDNMKESFSQVADIVDGVSCWYSNDSEGLNMLGDFVQWFKQNYSG